jgi:hypothetical protein
VIATRLVRKLEEKNHSRAAALWAIHRLIRSGMLQAEIPLVTTPFIATDPPAWMNGPVPEHLKNPPLVRPTFNGPVPYGHLLIRSSDALWDWWRTPPVVQPRPIPESILTVADPEFRQKATDAWRAASQLRRLMEQWKTWFDQLQSTGDADPGLASQMSEAVAVCVRALCALDVNMETFQQASPDDLLRRFPRPPSGELEPPELNKPEWRRETQTLLQRDDVLTDAQHRRQIREVMQRVDWLDDLTCRQRVGELLLQADWQSEHQHMLRYIGETLRSGTWQQDPEYRQQTREPLRQEGWNHLLAELLEFTQLLETAPSTGFISPAPATGERKRPKGNRPEKAAGISSGEGKKRRKRGRPVDTDTKADQRIYNAWQSSQYRTFEELARNLGKDGKEIKEAVDRHRKRLERKDE